MQPYPVRRAAIEAGRLMITLLLRWKPMAEAVEGYSLMLGVPWDLRHLLPVNLRFIQATKSIRLVDINVVFDSGYQPEMDAIEKSCKDSFPGLPLRFHHYNAPHAAVVRRLDTANFYNASNCALGLSVCKTRHMIVHDFDLYPTRPDYFEKVYDAIYGRKLRFCGLEHTHVDGMTDADNLMGTWCLAVDAEWIRKNYRPVDIFHRIVKLDGKLIHLDPFSQIQLETPERGAVETIDGEACCHVRNLPSTYLMLVRGRQPKIVWRLHYLWYLEDLSDGGERLPEVILAMDACEDGHLKTRGHEVDFNGVDKTCANVLRDDLTRMEGALFGEPREHVLGYIDSFQRFLERWGA